jgi:hypothetical protein
MPDITNYGFLWSSIRDKVPSFAFVMATGKTLLKVFREAKFFACFLPDFMRVLLASSVNQ